MDGTCWSCLESTNADQFSSVSPIETSCLFDGASTVGSVRFRGLFIVEDGFAMVEWRLLGQIVLRDIEIQGFSSYPVCREVVQQYSAQR